MPENALILDVLPGVDKSGVESSRASAVVGWTGSVWPQLACAEGADAGRWDRVWAFVLVSAGVAGSWGRGVVERIEGVACRRLGHEW